MTTDVEPYRDLSARAGLEALRRALRYARPFRRRFAIKVGLMASTILPLVLLPWPAKFVIDNVIEGRPIDDPVRPYPAFILPFVELLEGRTSGEILVAAVGFQLFLFLLIGAFGSDANERSGVTGNLAAGHDTATRTENEANAGFSLAGGLFGMLDFRFTMRLTQALNHHYRSRLFERIHALPLPAFDDERIGDAVYRVMYDTPAVTNACYRILLTPIGAPLNIIFTALVIGWTFGDQPALVLSALAVAPVALVATLPFAGAMRRRSSVSRRAGAVTTATAEEGMANILAVQSLGGESHQRERFDRDSWASFSQYRSVFLAGAGAFLAGTVLSLGIVGYVFLTVVDLTIADEISRGDFVLLFTYFFQIAVSTWGLGALWFDLQGSAAGLQRVFFLMDLPGEKDAAEAHMLPRIRDRVSVENVAFRYADGAQGLTDVSFTARVGHMIALVGPAGAGKTTLAYLIPRFVVPQSGRVLIDGIDTGEVSLTSLRSQIAFVFQETVLFAGNVADNIRVGKADATDSEIHEAARLAGADEFVSRLPHGYDTQLGRGGAKLSVGQKQRLSIARALVRQAPILILDEPTAALDPNTERQLVETLREASRERMVIVIAHRLSTVRAADEILFLDRGRIIERGSHAQLMINADGAYRRFWELQAGGVRTN